MKHKNPIYTFFLPNLNLHFYHQTLHRFNASQQLYIFFVKRGTDFFMPEL